MPTCFALLRARWPRYTSTSLTHGSVESTGHGGAAMVGTGHVDAPGRIKRSILEVFARELAWTPELLFACESPYPRSQCRLLGPQSDLKFDWHNADLCRFFRAFVWSSIRPVGFAPCGRWNRKSVGSPEAVPLRSAPPTKCIVNI
eukprot:6210498-Pleurochrysis_carterae.AAC.1